MKGVLPTVQRTITEASPILWAASYFEKKQPDNLSTQIAKINPIEIFNRAPSGRYAAIAMLTVLAASLMTVCASRRLHRAQPAPTPSPQINQANDSQAHGIPTNDSQTTQNALPESHQQTQNPTTEQSEIPARPLTKMQAQIEKVRAARNRVVQLNKEKGNLVREESAELNRQYRCHSRKGTSHCTGDSKS